MPESETKRSRRFSQKISLTAKMLMVTGVVGLAIWAISDKFETNTLQKIFTSNLNERLSQQARQQRTHFDRYVKGHHQTALIVTSARELHNHINRKNWARTGKPIIIHETTPKWLSTLSALRKFTQLRCVSLLDHAGKVREVYQGSSCRLPKTLLEPSSLLIATSHNQSFLTNLDGTPYLVTSESITNKTGHRLATLMIVSPIDEEFLLASQGAYAGETTVALLETDQDAILVSSNPDELAAGAKLEKLKERYLITGQGLFDYGASDLVVTFISFIPITEVEKLTSVVMVKARQARFITATVFILAFSLIMYWITTRISKLTNRIVEFSEHAEVTTTEQRGGDEIYVLEERFKLLMEEVRLEKDALQHQALHDPLTGLPNRLLLQNNMEQEIHRSQRTNKPFVLIVSDLNRFKEINDTLGHHIGDIVLQQSGERFIELLRKSDTTVRLGGDEFGILLPETNLSDATHIAEKISLAFDKPFLVEDHSLSIGISLGIVEYPIHGDNVQLLMQRADIAMYAAKRTNIGFNVYDPTNDQYSRDRLELMAQLREAIRLGTLELYYQPIVDLRSGKTTMAEALLRWNHEEYGYVSPTSFVPLAEQTGLIKPLTDWVINQALNDCARWIKAGFNLSVSVNLSAHSLHDIALADSLAAKLDEKELQPCHLQLELTEGSIMTDPVRAKEILTDLHDLGVSLSVDDFGTGYSSLGYLKQLPVNHIKIDRTFVTDMNKDESDAVIVQATIGLAHNLGLEVVAEGVENLQTLELLEQLGCDYLQGFYISHPVPYEEFVKWMNTSPWGNASADEKKILSDKKAGPA